MVTKSKSLDFMNWAFTKRDADGLIIAYLLFEAISGFIRNIIKAIINPVIEAIMPKKYMEENEQILNVFGVIRIRFQLQYLISGFIQMMLILLIAYLLLTYLYKALDLEVK